MSKFIPQHTLCSSPVTKEGSLVMSRSGSAVQELDGQLVVIHGSYQIDGEDVMSILKFLDEKAPLFAATKKLSDLGVDLRKELHSIWEAVDV